MYVYRKSKLDVAVGFTSFFSCVSPSSIAPELTAGRASPALFSYSLLLPAPTTNGGGGGSSGQIQFGFDCVCVCAMQSCSPYQLSKSLSSAAFSSFFFSNG